jgi:hypothetical protein
MVFCATSKPCEIGDMPRPAAKLYELLTKTTRINMKKIIGLHVVLAALLGFASFANAGFEAEPNNTLATATPMRLNEVYTGNFESVYLHQDDYFKFTLTKSTEIVFHYRNITPTGNYPGLFEVLDNLGTTRYMQGSSTDLVDHVARVNLAAGIFYVHINTYFGTNSYEFSAQSPLSVPRPITIPSVISSVNMPDLNRNGYKDMAVLRILANANAVVDTIDGLTGKLLKRVVYITDSRLIQPISLISFDLESNGSPDIGVLGYNSTTGKHAQYFRNALTGALIKSFIIN